MTAARVGFFCAPDALPSLSMERYATSLCRAVREVDATLELSKVRPETRNGDAHGSLVRRSRLRFVDYPRHAAATDFDVNHIVDHAYAHLARALDPRRTVITCHDVFPVLHWRGEIAGLPRRRRPPLTVHYSLTALARAARVITPSAATRDALVARYRVDASRIHVIPYGVDASFTAGERERARAELGIEGGGRGLVLSVETGAPYKNVHGTLRVLASVRHQLGNVRLLHVGPPFDGSNARLARNLGVADAIINLGTVPLQRMPAVYRAADLLLFPSLYEGFGWPPLEAMASGVPVVCSTWRSLDEVVGDAALRADFDDQRTLVDHVRLLLTDERASSDLIRRGSARAELFTWRRAAEATVSVYQSIFRESE